MEIKYTKVEYLINLQSTFNYGILSFTNVKKQLSAQEVETSRNIASVCIHIERIIGLTIKSLFAMSFAN